MYPNGSSLRTKTPPPQLSATFVPNQGDHYHMPVISPIPQRSMPEVPDQMQQNLARLELDSTGLSPMQESGGFKGQDHNYQSTNYHLQNRGRPSPRASPMVSPRVSPRQSPRASPALRSREASPAPLSTEPFFPHIKNPPPNVPARAEETERVLESARRAVVTSNNPEMQITWAQDTLAFIDIADENNARMADAGLGRTQTPDVERRLRTDAVSIINFLSDQHHPKAEFLRGTWLEFGKFGCEADKPQAYRCFSTSARNGYARAEYRLGMQFEETGEIDRALRHYDLGIQAGDAASNYRIGMMYLLGQRGYPQDLKRGLEYIRFSADNADENAPQGAYIYGMLLARELPQVTISEQLLPRDTAGAKYYLEKAAYLGFAKAQTRIGTAYELQQLNCEFDPVYSLHYNQLAARQGEPEAEMAISKWFLSGYDGLFPKNEALSYEYALRAAVSGFPTAEFAIGYFNEVGIHVPSNLKEAKAWYSKAAEHGNEDAKGRITGISRSKTLSRRDHDNMALAKINSVRGRPSTSQQNLRMPQVDTYRNPSPVPVVQTPAYTVNDPYRTNTSQNLQQGPPSDPRWNNRNERPDTNSQDMTGSTYGNRLRANSPGRNVYNQPSVSSAPAEPYSNRQSSLPQGQRATSQNFPLRVPADQQHLSPSNMPPPAQTVNSNNSLAPKMPYPADIGYTAPVDFAGADRRRIVSGPAGRGSSPSGPRQGNNTPVRKALPQSQGSSPIPRLQTAVASQPDHTSKVSSPARTPVVPPKTSSASEQPSKRPAKGPSTFAEMGIPQAKQDSDCIVM